MTISHKYNFIFIKTLKTAGTSLEIYLSQMCGNGDIVTPIEPSEIVNRLVQPTGFKLRIY